MANAQLGRRRATKLVKTSVSSEQVAYAEMIGWGQWIGLFIILVTFFAYISGTVPGLISPEEIAQNWHLSTDEYLQVTGSPTGWKWVTMLGYGDFLSLIGVMLLAGLTILAYTFYLVPAYLRKGDIPFLTIVVIEVIVLVIAASGILGTGGH